MSHALTDRQLAILAEQYETRLARGRISPKEREDILVSQCLLETIQADQDTIRALGIPRGRYGADQLSLVSDLTRPWTQSDDLPGNVGLAISGCTRCSWRTDWVTVKEGEQLYQRHLAGHQEHDTPSAH
jgi:hypothetical protein